MSINKVHFLDYSPNDDFICTFTQLMGCLRWFGIPWAGARLQRVWCSVLTSGLFIGIIFATNRMFTEKFTGKMFLNLAGTAKYMSGFAALLMLHRLKRLWSSLSKAWTTANYNSCGEIGIPIKSLRLMLINIAIGFVVLCTVERLLKILSSESLRTKSTLLEILKDYILKYHEYIISTEQYTTVLGVIFFIQIQLTTLISNLDDFIIIAFSMALVSRQQHLNNQLKCLCENNSCDFNGIKKTSSIVVSTNLIQLWRKVRESFVRQIHLVQQVNFAIGPLILLALFTNLLYILMIVFALNYEEDMYTVGYYIYTLAWLGVRCVALIHTAANVHVMSQRGADYLKMIKTSSCNVEVRRLDFQLSKNEVALTGMGFFKLKRSLMLKMLSVIVTYDLILLQYDDRLSQS